MKTEIKYECCSRPKIKKAKSTTIYTHGYRGYPIRKFCTSCGAHHTVCMAPSYVPPKPRQKKEK